MELWDIYNAEREKTGATMVRGDKIQPGDHHIVVHVCVFNSKGQMLIQQRQPFKECWSGRWDISAGGSAVAGDTSCVAIHREMLEEIGIDYDFTNIRPRFTVNFHGGFDDVYIIDLDVDISTLKLQYEEVNQVKWADKDEIFRMIDSEEFVPYRKSLISLIFDMRSGFGMTN